MSGYKRLLSVFLFGFCVILSGHATVIYSVGDSLIFEKYVEEFIPYKNIPSGELMTKTALFFLGTPYVASTLEKSDEEILTVNLREFDCTTFVETCLALTRIIQSGNTSFQNYCDILQRIRYRNGTIEDYSSRLHYVSDWIRENEKHQVFTDITEKLGGTKIFKQINFMSAHPASYHQLAESREIKNKIKKSEEELNKTGSYTVIKKDEVRKVVNLTKDGDIVAFSTAIPGLDFSHIGIIYTTEEQTTFIHASTSKKEVTIERKSLAEYCTSSKKCDGIVILRLN